MTTNEYIASLKGLPLCPDSTVAKLIRMLEAAISGLTCDCNWPNNQRCEDKFPGEPDEWCGPCQTIAGLDLIA